MQISAVSHFRANIYTETSVGYLLRTGEARREPNFFICTLIEIAIQGGNLLDAIGGNILTICR